MADIGILVLEGSQFIGGTAGYGDRGRMGMTGGEVTESELILCLLVPVLCCCSWGVVFWLSSEFIAQ